MTVLLAAMATATESVPVRKATPVKLADLDAAPESYLGKRVEFLATLAKEPVTASGALAVQMADRKKPVNLNFTVGPRFTAKLQTLPSGNYERPVSVVGVVVAPSRPNAPYGFEVDEIRIYDPNGTLLTTINDTAPSVKPPETTPSNEAKSADATNAATDTADGPSIGTMIAAGIAVVVGLFVAVLLFKRRKPTPKTPPPASSISDRLNRRVR